MSSAIEERPKSARQGYPCALMTMLRYKNMSRASVSMNSNRGMGNRNHTNAFQVTVNNFMGMQVVQTADNTK